MLSLRLVRYNNFTLLHCECKITKTEQPDRLLLASREKSFNDAAAGDAWRPHRVHHAMLHVQLGTCSFYSFQKLTYSSCHIGLVDCLEQALSDNNSMATQEICHTKYNYHHDKKNDLTFQFYLHLLRF